MSDNKVVYPNNAGGVNTFYFEFPFFQNSDVQVYKNGALLASSEYALHKNQGGASGDYPYIGGSIEFTNAPKENDRITIKRRLTLQRTVDYQPTAQILPTSLNRDFNFIVEYMKELENIYRAAIDAGEIDWDEITANITDLNQSLDEANQGVAGLNQQLSSVNSQIDNYKLAFAALKLGGNKMTAYWDPNSNTARYSYITPSYEAVLNSTTPATAAQNITGKAQPTVDATTWYRLRMDGWAEQGGYKQTSSAIQTVVFPLPMKNTDYNVFISVSAADSPQIETGYYKNKTATQMYLSKVWLNQGTPVLTGGTVSWKIQGMAA